MALTRPDGRQFQLAAASFCERCERVAHDPETARVYVAAESGWVSIFDHQQGHLTGRGSAHLADGAHSLALDPTTHHTYFPIPKGANGSPVLWESEPAT